MCVTSGKVNIAGVTMSLSCHSAVIEFCTELINLGGRCLDTSVIVSLNLGGRCLNTSVIVSLNSGGRYGVDASGAILNETW